MLCSNRHSYNGIADSFCSVRLQLTDAPEPELSGKISSITFSLNILRGRLRLAKAWVGICLLKDNVFLSLLKKTRLNNRTYKSSLAVLRCRRRRSGIHFVVEFWCFHLMRSKAESTWTDFTAVLEFNTPWRVWVRHGVSSSVQLRHLRTILGTSW